MLILLGLAWNFTFIAGSALMLPDGAVLDAGASRRVQGAAEAATFAAVGAASAASGALLGAIGWRGLCALRRAVRGGYDVVRVERGVRGCDQLLAERGASGGGRSRWAKRKRRRRRGYSALGSL